MKKRFPVTGPAVDPICCDGGGDGRLIEELPGAADTVRPHLIMGRRLRHSMRQSVIHRAKKIPCPCYGIWVRSRQLENKLPFKV